MRVELHVGRHERMFACRVGRCTPAQAAARQSTRRSHAPPPGRVQASSSREVARVSATSTPASAPAPACPPAPTSVRVQRRAAHLDAPVGGQARRRRRRAPRARPPPPGPGRSARSSRRTAARSSGWARSRLAATSSAARAVRAARARARPRPAGSASDPATDPVAVTDELERRAVPRDGERERRLRVRAQARDAARQGQRRAALDLQVPACAGPWRAPCGARPPRRATASRSSHAAQLAVRRHRRRRRAS